MAKTLITAGDDVLATKANQNWGLNSLTIAYNANGSVNTVTDSTTATVYTFAYNGDGTVNTITDTSNTWTFTYVGETVTAVTRT